MSGLPPATDFPSFAKSRQVVEIQEFIDARYSNRHVDQDAKALYVCAHDTLNRLILGDLLGADQCLGDMSTLRPEDGIAFRKKLAESDLLPR